MADWVVESTRAAMKAVVDLGAKIGLANTEEFTFRSNFMLAASAQPNLAPAFYTEWDRFDLLVAQADKRTIIEFKYYLLRSRFDLGGNPVSHKGGAGTKNEAEFWKCVKKLRECHVEGIHEKFLVLVFQNDYSKTSKHSFVNSYGSLATNGDIAAVESLSEGPLDARILTIRS